MYEESQKVIDDADDENIEDEDTFPRNEDGLLQIFQNLGEVYLPHVQAEDFFYGQSFEPTEPRDRDTWRREIGVKLALRVIDSVFTEFSQDLLEARNEGLKLEQTLRSEIKLLKAEIHSLRHESKNDENSPPSKLKKQQATKNIKDMNNPAHKGAKTLSNPAKKGSKTKKVVPEQSLVNSTVLVDLLHDQENSQELRQGNPRKQKRKLVGEEAGKIFSKRGKPDIVDASPSRREKDRSFVPETMPLFLPTPVKPGSLHLSIPESPEKCKQPSILIETQAPVIEVVDLHDEAVIETPSSTPTNKPYISQGNSIATQKSPIFHRISKNPLSGKPCKLTRKSRKNIVSQQPQQAGKQDEAEKNVDHLEEEEKTLDKSEEGKTDKQRKIVSTISVKKQKEIDRKAWAQIINDFSGADNSNKDEEYDEDFESPNLLRVRPVCPIKSKSRSATPQDLDDDISIFSSPPEREPPKLPVPNIREPTEGTTTAKKVEKKKPLPKLKKITNRWGIEVEELTASVKKKISNQHQSKIDRYFRNNPDSAELPENDFQKAIRLSKEHYEKMAKENENEPGKEKERLEPEKEKPNTHREKREKERLEPEKERRAAQRERTEKEPNRESKERLEPEKEKPNAYKERVNKDEIRVGARKVSDRSRKEERTEAPKVTNKIVESDRKWRIGTEQEAEVDPFENKRRKEFAYVGPTVRKREERMKLKGYDCAECREYYRSKLEDGYTEEQIEAIINKCSRHRAVYKPPLTPEKFWDPDIIEGDPDDPRNKTQNAPPLRTRATRRREKRDRIRSTKPEAELNIIPDPTQDEDKDKDFFDVRR